MCRCHLASRYNTGSRAGLRFAGTARSVRRASCRRKALQTSSVWRSWRPASLSQEHRLTGPATAVWVRHFVTRPPRHLQCFVDLGIEPQPFRGHRRDPRLQRQRLSTSPRAASSRPARCALRRSTRFERLQESTYPGPERLNHHDTRIEAGVELQRVEVDEEACAARLCRRCIQLPGV